MGSPRIQPFQGIKAGGFISFLQFAVIPPNHYESDDTKEQARQAFENLKIFLGAAGAGLEHVIKVTVYLQVPTYRPPFHDWMEYFPKDPPARIAIQVTDANAATLVATPILLSM